LVADCHSISARWRNHFSQLLNVNEVNDVSQTEIHSAGPIMFGPRGADNLKAKKTQITRY